MLEQFKMVDMLLEFSFYFTGKKFQYRPECNIHVNGKFLNKYLEKKKYVSFRYFVLIQTFWSRY